MRILFDVVVWTCVLKIGHDIIPHDYELSSYIEVSLLVNWIS